MLSAILIFCALPVGADPAADKSFETHIRPLLEKHCISCHGPNKQKGGLRLDSSLAMIQGGDNGSALAADHLEKSLFLQVVRYDGEIKMPPAGKLKPAEIARLEQWVRAGAAWPAAAKTPAPATAAAKPAANPLPWWGSRPMASAPPSLPAGIHPIDYFLEKARKAAGVNAAPPASRRDLLRRLSFDLIGLPPTLAEIRAFERDTAADAFSKQVDRLLASPAYGEKWGRKWLDVARYADSNGMDENLAHGLAYRYRDWVIDAINADLPYDRFLTMQIAGDLLAPVADEKEMRKRLIATGFLSIGPKMLAEDDPVKMRMDIVDEQIDTLGQAFMGMTLGCARCHDHKFDPISTADYYALAGIFKSTDTMETYSVVARWRERPLVGPAAEKKLDQEKSDLEKSKKKLEDERRRVRSQRVEEEKKKASVYLSASKEALEAQSVRKLVQPGSTSLIVEAEDFARGNVRKDKDHYGKGIGVLVNLGPVPNFTEYDLQLDQPGYYRVWIRYAAADPRPIRVKVAGKIINDSAADQATGSWTPEGQQWFHVATMRSPKGAALVRLERDGAFPHIDKLAFEHHTLAPVQPANSETLATKKNLSHFLLKRVIGFRKDHAALSEADLAKEYSAQIGEIFKEEAALDSLIPEGVLKGLDEKKAELEKIQKKFDGLDMAMAVKDGKVEDVPVHIRGNHLTLGKPAPRGFPEVLRLPNSPALPTSHSGRLELANWLSRPDHPLTARVLVNRLWQGHFGTGLVRSVDNFGNLGESPSHPELLDWLAGELVKSGWSMKALHRLILTSAAWQQSTRWDAAAHQKDPDNRLLWRMDRRRLNAEEFRDAMLAVSAKLDSQGGGTLLGVEDRKYVTSTANQAYTGYTTTKRSIYLPVIRSALYDFFQVFDFPDPSAIHGERSVTVVPTQALFLLNGKLLDESAIALAKRFRPAKPELEAAAVASLLEELFGRPPQHAETERIHDFLARHPGDSWKGLCRVLLSSNEFLYLD